MQSTGRTRAGGRAHRLAHRARLRQLRRGRLGAGVLRPGADRGPGVRADGRGLGVGIGWFDTADAYGGGRSERAIGRWMASRGVRPRLTTKTFNPMQAGADHGLKPDRIARQLRSSLDRLGVDQVDLYLAHDYDPDVPLAEVFGAFERRPGRRADRRLRGQQLRRRPARGRARRGHAAGRAEQLLAARAAGRAGRAAAVRRARRRLPGVRAAGGRLAHRQVPARRAVPGRVADDPAARALPGAGHRPDLRRAGPAAGDRREPRHLAGRARARLAAGRRSGHPGRDRPGPPGAPGPGRRGAERIRSPGPNGPRSRRPGGLAEGAAS